MESKSAVQVYLIRHAQCELNVQLDDAPLSTRLSRKAFNTLVRGDLESPLTPEGIAQAKRLADQLAEVHFDRLYTSPLPRAMATAAALSETLHLTPQVMDDLRELRSALLRERAGELSLRRLFWQSYSRMLLSPTSPDAFSRSYRRAQAAWNQITREPAEAIAVVSHGFLLRFLLLHILTDRRWRIISRDLNNCGISLVVPRGASAKPGVK
jgi:broad specificity phosphatase PhoE